MAKVNDFARELSEKYGLSQSDASDFIDLMFGVIKEQLSSPDSSVKIKGFGTFKVSAVGARASVDVNTGERIILDGRNKISFTPEVLLRDRVNRPFVQFETVVLNDGVDFSGIDNEPVSLGEDDEPVGSEEDNELEITNVGILPDEESADSDSKKADSDTESAEDNADNGASDDAQNDTQAMAAADTEVAEDADGRENVETTTADASPAVQGVQDGPRPTASKNVDTAKHREIARKLMIEEPDETGKNEAEKDEDGLARPVCRQRSPRLMYMLSLASFLLLVALGVGMYLLYMRVEEKNNVIGRLENRLTVQADSLRNENIQREGIAESADVSAQNRKELKDSVSVKKNPVAASVPHTSPSDYNYDVRVRTGAYIIVGVSKTVVVRQGQTLSSISKAYLGEGMECYVEVLNNCVKVKPGDKLKIPELKLKPRRN